MRLPLPSGLVAGVSLCRRIVRGNGDLVVRIVEMHTVRVTSWSARARLVGSKSRVEFAELAFLAAGATDRVVAAHHVGDGGGFLVAGTFLLAGRTRMLRVVAETVRPAVSHAVDLRALRGSVGADGERRGAWIRNAAGALERESAVIEILGCHLFGALFVGDGEKGAEILPILIGGGTTVPLANVEIKLAGIHEDFATDADERDVRDRVIAGLSDLLALDETLAKRLDAFGWFPREFEFRAVDVQRVLVDLSARSIEVFDQLAGRDLGETEIGVFQRADAIAIDGSDKLLLEGRFCHVAGVDFLEIAVALVANLVDLCRRGACRNDRLRTGVDGSDPVVGSACLSSIRERIVPSDAQDEGSVSKGSITTGGGDSRGIGKELAFQLLEG